MNQSIDGIYISHVFVTCVLGPMVLICAAHTVVRIDCLGKTAVNRGHKSAVEPLFKFVNLQ